MAQQAPDLFERPSGNVGISPRPTVQEANAESLASGQM